MYPVCLNITGKLCVAVGGGSVAERKVRGLLAGGARVRVISPAVIESLAELAEQDVIEWQQKKYSSGDLAGAFLVFAATDRREVQQAILHDAILSGQLINVVDDPDSCSFQVPATVQRGDLTLAVATGGKSPAVAAMIRGRLEKEYGQEYEILLELVSMIRDRVLASAVHPDDRKNLFQNILHDDIVYWIRTGQWEALREHLYTVLDPDVTLDFSKFEQEMP